MPWMMIISLILIVAGSIYLFQRNTTIVPEDHQAVVVDSQGFVKRVISAGPHHLKPWREKIEFTIETKTRLVQGTAADVPTAEGILLTVQWSGTYRPNTELITENLSQRLRGLPKAPASIQRKVDVVLRRLVSAYTLRELFRPVIRDRIERQLTEALKSQLSSSGIVLNGIDLQAIIPPEEVLHALNQAQAIQTLDTAIRASDTATRDMVAGAHQLEELIEWGKLFPPYGRYALSQPVQAQ
jgi:regulator of protease activity HflC (stomatin/prohibitin superfamily)